MKKIHILLVLFLVPLALFAKDVKVYGYVYTPDREPAIYAAVQVQGTNIGTTTREDGYYELQLTVDTAATVQYVLLGCETATVRLTAKQNSIQKIIYLKESSIHLDDMEVKVLGKEATTLSSLDLSKTKLIPDAGGGGIESLLSTYAGVSSNNEMSSQYSVRGGSYDENSVYVNNIEIYRPMLIRSGQQEGLSFINPDMVERVSFSAGGFEPEYGDKMASVLDIFYKKPKGFEASVGISLLGASAYLGHTTKNGKFSQIHGFRYKTSDYLLSTLDTEGVYDQKFMDYQTYLTYQFAKKWEIDFLGNFSQNRYTSIPESMKTTFGTYDNPTTFQVFFEGKEKDLFQTLFGAASLKYKPTQSVLLSLIASAFSTREEMNYDISSEYWLSKTDKQTAITDETTIGVGSYLEYARNKLDATVLNLSHRGEYKLKKNHLKWGVGFQQERISDRMNEFQLRDSAGYSLPHDSRDVVLYYNLHADLEQTSYRTQFFVQDTYRIPTTKGTITLTGGLRGNYWTFNHEFIVSPRATVAYFPRWKQEFAFRFSTGLYYQSPFYKEIRKDFTDSNRNTYITLNDDILAQRSLHFVLGSDYFFKIYDRPFKFTSEIYYKPADRVTTYTVDNVKIVYSGENDAKAYAAGIDFKLFGEFVPSTDSWISLSLMQSKEDVAGDNIGWVSRPNEQRYNFSMFFQDYFPGFPKYKVHLKFIWADGFPFWAPNVNTHSNKNTNRAKAYRRVDIGATRSFVKGDVKWLDRTQIFRALKSINLGLEVFNLLDISNVASYYWVSDTSDNQHAVPNFLTKRQFNFRLSLDF